MKCDDSVDIYVATCLMCSVRCLFHAQSEGETPGVARTVGWMAYTRSASTPVVRGGI